MLEIHFGEAENKADHLVIDRATPRFCHKSADTRNICEHIMSEMKAREAREIQRDQRQARLHTLVSQMHHQLCVLRCTVAAVTGNIRIHPKVDCKKLVV